MKFNFRLYILDICIFAVCIIGLVLRSPYRPVLIFLTVLFGGSVFLWTIALISKKPHSPTTKKNADTED